MMNWQELLSDFGNALVASAAALIILAWLWRRLGWVAGLVFLVCLAGMVGSVIGLKFMAYDLRPPVGETSILSLSQGAPSGHTAFATFVYGGMAAILATADRRPGAWIAGLLCIAVVAAVAITRVTLTRHTIGDVLAGLAVGGIGVGLFARALVVQLQGRRLRAIAPFVAVMVVTVTLLASGLRLNTLALL
jgi:membrane-associated phospholipid phosphatase